MQRRDVGDFGDMLYGRGPLAVEILEARRKRSREVILVMDKPDGSRVDITLIRFAEWVEAHRAVAGGEIFLDLPHMGARGFARVIAINPCFPLPPPDPDYPTARLITGKFRHSSAETFDLKLASENKPIGVTATHPFWSVDRGAWVSAVHLRIGETLKTLTGTTQVESMVKRPHPEPVYNIEVDIDHVYRVGESGVLVHNASAADCNECDLEEEIRTKLGDPLLHLGPFAKESVSASDPDRTTEAEKDRIDRIGNQHGDHHTGVHDPGQRRWTPDHQPVTALVRMANTNSTLHELME